MKTPSAKTTRSAKPTKANTAKGKTAVAQSNVPAKKAAPAVVEAVVAPQPLCAQSRTQVGKLQRRMLSIIDTIGTHPGKALRVKRFADYKVGMTLQHCKETTGLDHLDVGFYVEHKLMTVRPATDKEWEAAVKAQADQRAKTAATVAA